jgi:hypothetical protein
MNHVGLIVLGLGVLAWTARLLAARHARKISSPKHPAPLEGKGGATPPAAPDAESLLKELHHTREPLSRHQLYTRLLQAAYRDRNRETSRRLLLDQGARYLAELEGLLPHLRADMGPEPEVPALKWMVATLVEDGQHEEALAICRRAEAWQLSDGTKTGFAGRRLRIERKRRQEAISSEEGKGA